MPSAGPRLTPRGPGGPAEPRRGWQLGPTCQQPAIPGDTDGGWEPGRRPYPPSSTLSLFSAPGRRVCLESMCGTLPPWVHSPHSPGTPAVPRGAECPGRYPPGGPHCALQCWSQDSFTEAAAVRLQSAAALKARYREPQRSLPRQPGEHSRPSVPLSSPS